MRAERKDISFLEMATVLLRHRRLIIGIPCAAVIIVAAVCLIRPRTFSVSTLFAPQASGVDRSSLSGIAAQFGMALPATAQGQSPAFYVELVTSRAILGKVAAGTYQINSGDERGFSYIELNRIRGPSEAARTEKAYEHLRRRVRVNHAREAGIVSVRVRAMRPILAQQLSQALLGQLNEFNVRTRQSRATAEKRFVEGRYAESIRDLRQAENLLKTFLQKNRLFDGSPELRFEFQRLEREVGLRQQIATSLAEALERARMDEIRDIPVITVLQQPIVPVRPDSRGLLKWGIVAGVFGLFLSVFIAFVRSFALKDPIDAADNPEQFQMLVQRFGSEIKRPWKLLVPAGGSEQGHRPDD